MVIYPPSLSAKGIESAPSFAERCSKLSKAKDWPGLEALARQQIATDPKDANAQAALGFSLLAQNKRAEGKAACVAALKLNPKHLQALFYLGIECAQEGDAKGALATGRQIESINPLAAIQFMRNPSVQHAVAPGADPILVEASQVHVKADSIESLHSYMEEAAKGRLAVVVLALTVDENGVPILADTLVSSPGLLHQEIEKAVMELGFIPLKANGSPIPFRMIFTMTVNGPDRQIFNPKDLGKKRATLPEVEQERQDQRDHERGGKAVGGAEAW